MELHLFILLMTPQIIEGQATLAMEILENKPTKRLIMFCSNWWWWFVGRYCYRVLGFL